MNKDHARPTSPLQVARIAAFTSREKLAWLTALKAELTAEHVDARALDYDLDDIDRAMDLVREDALKGTTPAPLGRGYNGWH